MDRSSVSHYSEDTFTYNEERRGQTMIMKQYNRPYSRNSIEVCVYFRRREVAILTLYGCADMLTGARGLDWTCPGYGQVEEVEAWILWYCRLVCWVVCLGLGLNGAVGNLCADQMMLVRHSPKGPGTCVSWHCSRRFRCFTSCIFRLFSYAEH